MIVVIILLFTVFAFYTTYISCLYVLNILKCEPRDFPWCGFVITSILIAVLLRIVTFKKYIVLFLLFISLMIWILHFVSYMKRIIKKENLYPFTNKFHIDFLVSVVMHILLVVEIIRM